MDEYRGGGGGYRGGGGRSPKRFRHGDDFRHADYDRYGPGPHDGPRHGGPPPYDRRGPPGPGGPPGGYRDRYFDGPPRDGPPGRDPYRRDYRDPSPPPPPQRRGPLPYKEFMRELPDDITPEDAQKEFQAYLTRWWGSKVKADFEARKEDPAVRRQFDPREHQKAVDQRNKIAASTASNFLEDWENGKLDPTAEDFNQGNGAAPAADADADASADDATAAAPSQEAVTSPAAAAAPSAAAAAAADPQTPRSAKKVAPEVSWQPARLASDLGLARELASKLDAEKGITENPLLADGSSANGKGTSAPNSGGSTPAERDEDAAAAAPATASEAGREESPAEVAGKLDVVLMYLWRVHGVDYYAGSETLEPEDSQRAGPRPTLRCPRPEEGEHPDETVHAQQEAILEKGVDAVWRARMGRGDPFQDPLHAARVEAHMEEWVAAQVVKIDEKKWGSKVSQKLFVDREYVLKHIRNKHGHLLAAERDQFLDQLYFENFKAARDEEDRLAKEATARARKADLIARGVPAEEWGVDGAQNGANGFGPAGALPQFAAGGGMGMMDVPAGCVLVPAPGAGPLGPFIPVPIDEAPAGAAMMGVGGRGGRGMGMPMGPMGGRGRMGPMGAPLAMAARGPPRMGGPGMGSAGSGGFGGGGSGMLGGMGLVAPSRREYVDLDDPSNNRKVLDYSDL